MKIQVTITEPQKDGYFYASPLNKDFNQNYGDFSALFAPAEITEFYAPDFIDYLDISMIEPIMEHWLYMLRNGGQLIIGGLDPYIMSKNLIARRLDLNALNNQLFKRPTPMRCMFPMVEMRRLLTKMGCEILEINIDEGGLWTIKAQK